MNFKLKSHFSLLFFLYSTLLFSQPPHLETLSVFSEKKLKEDFKILRSSIEKSHAGLYSYISKKELDQAFDEIEQAIQQPMNSIEFFRKISPLLKLIGNGHTNFLPPPDYNMAINSTLPRFPFAIYWHEGRMYVLRNLSNNENIRAGTIIKSINGELAEKVFEELANNLTRDAHNTSWAEGKVSRDFSGNYAFFKGTPDLFDLELMDKNGKIQNFQIKGLINSEIGKNAKKRYSNWLKLKRVPKKLPLTFEIKNGIGKLVIRSFDKPTIKKSGQNYKDFFKDTFAKIESQNVEHLILDVRDNGGGYPEVVIELNRYLSKIPHIQDVEAFTITKKLPNRKYYKDGFWESLDMRKTLRLKKDGDIYRVTKGMKKKTYPPAKNNFKGELYVLINPFSFSATTDLLAMLKNSKRGIFIGETAGGNPHRTTAWLLPTLILPNTKIHATIPLVHMKTTYNFKENKTGIQPDFHVKNNIEEMIKGTDAVMEFTLDLIQKKK